MLDYNLGILALLSYNLLTAAKGVFLGSFLQKVDPFIVLSLCFGLVTIIFILINLIKRSSDSVKALPVLKKRWKLVIVLNVSAVFSWASYFYALKLIEPAILFSLIEGVGPVVTTICYLIIKENIQTSRLEWFSHTLTCIILGFLVLISYLGLSAVGNISTQAVFLGTIAALICGISNVAMAILTKNLNNDGLKARQIIPARFFLLIVIGAFLVPKVQWEAVAQGEAMISIAVIAVAGLALPIYFSQVGIQKTNPMTVALTFAALPIFTLACQFFDNRLTASIYSIVGAFAVAVIYMISLVLKSPPQITIRKPAYSKE